MPVREVEVSAAAVVRLRPLVVANEQLGDVPIVRIQVDLPPARKPFNPELSIDRPHERRVTVASGPLHTPRVQTAAHSKEPTVVPLPKLAGSVAVEVGVAPELIVWGI